MRILDDLSAAAEPLGRKRTQERDERLSRFLTEDVEHAFMTRHTWEQEMQQDLRDYEAIPEEAFINVPLEGTPNVEIPLAAIAVDSLYAQVIDLIFTASPIVTVRPTGTSQEEYDLANALQRFIAWGVEYEWKLRAAAEDATLDCIKLGSGALYIPWVESVKKTAKRVVRDVGPRILAIPPEDLVFPAGLQRDAQLLPWIGWRQYLSESEMRERTNHPDKDRAWDDAAMLCGAPSATRQERERGGRSMPSAVNQTYYEVILWYGYFDYDDDGLDEDLLVVWDRTSRNILWAGFNAEEQRPFGWMVYQKRSHMMPGLGVTRMLSQFQREMTESHKDRIINSRMANLRLFIGKPGMVGEGKLLTLHHGKFIPATDPQNDLKEFKLAEVYPSAYRDEAAVLQLAQQRVGVSDIVGGARPSAVLGSRTPGITALSLMQQANRRFTPAFDSMRLTLADAVKQCLYRYKVRIDAGDQDAVNNIRRVLGEDDARRVLMVLADEHFEDSVRVEMTASSVSVNKEADRQNAIMLIGTMGQYYERIMQLLALVADPNVPPPLKEGAQQIAQAASEMMKRTLRTFDQIRDPETFLVNMENAVDQTGVQPSVIEQLMTILAPQNGVPEALPIDPLTVVEGNA